MDATTLIFACTGLVSIVAIVAIVNGHGVRLRAGKDGVGLRTSEGDGGDKGDKDRVEPGMDQK